MPTSASSVLPATDSAENLRRRRWRMLKDRVATRGVALGGLSVILAIVLIFFYLLYVVLPLFASAKMERVADYAQPGAVDTSPDAADGGAQSGGPSLFLAMEEQTEIGFRLTNDAHAIFFNTHDGSLLEDLPLELPVGSTVTSFGVGDPGPARFILGLSNGSAVIARHVYKVTYPNDKRLITPGLEYPLGEEALEIDEDGGALTRVAFQDGESEATVVAHTADGRLLLTHFSKEESFADDAPSLEREQVVIAFADQSATQAEIVRLLLDREQRNLYIVYADGDLIHLDVSNKTEPRQLQHLHLTDVGLKVTSVQFLTGDLSLLVGDSSGLEWRMNGVIKP